MAVNLEAKSGAFSGLFLAENAKVAVNFGAITATFVAQCSHLGQVAVNIIDRLTCSVGNLVVAVSGYLK